MTIVPAPPPPEVPVDESLFPPGPEREFILDTCQGCHTLNLVARSGGSIEGWSDRLVRMIRAGAPIPREQIPALAAYLAKAFPERPRLQAPTRPRSGE
jgi:mono/diheme cytochrome c family protein